MSDLISRQDAIRLIENTPYDWSNLTERKSMINKFKALPFAQPEPAIPLQWIEEQIEWLKSLDNAFSDLTAGQISAMVNKWKGEQNG